MNRTNKTKNNLQEVWNCLDSAYESMENAIDKLSSMADLPEDFVSEIDEFDISAISSLKQRVEVMMDKFIVK